MKCGESTTTTWPPQRRTNGINKLCNTTQNVHQAKIHGVRARAAASAPGHEYLCERLMETRSGLLQRHDVFLMIIREDGIMCIWMVYHRHTSSGVGVIYLGRCPGGSRTSCTRGHLGGTSCCCSAYTKFIQSWDVCWEVGVDDYLLFALFFRYCTAKRRSNAPHTTLAVLPVYTCCCSCASP